MSVRSTTDGTVLVSDGDDAVTHLLSLGAASRETGQDLRGATARVARQRTRHLQRDARATQIPARMRQGSLQVQ